MDILQNSWLPCLLAKPSLKAMGMKMDFEQDTADFTIKGEPVRLHLDTTSSGHYSFPLLKGTPIPSRYRFFSPNLMSYLFLSFEDMGLPNGKFKEIFMKLHIQFGHVHPEKLCQMISQASHHSVSKSVLDLCRKNFIVTGATETGHVT